MRGSNPHPTDTPIGATVRRNVMACIAQAGTSPVEVYGALDIPQRTFWSQWKYTMGPRLSVLNRVAEHIGVPLWRFLLEPGQVGERSTGFMVNQVKPNPPDVRQMARHYPAMLFGYSAWDEMVQDTQSANPIKARVRLRALSYAMLEEMDWTDLRDGIGMRRAAWDAMWRRPRGPALVKVWQMAEVLACEPWEMVA